MNKIFVLLLGFVIFSGCFATSKDLMKEAVDLSDKVERKTKLSEVLEKIEKELKDEKDKKVLEKLYSRKAFAYILLKKHKDARTTYEKLIGMDLSSEQREIYLRELYTTFLEDKSNFYSNVEKGVEYILNKKKTTKADYFFLGYFYRYLYLGSKDPDFKQKCQSALKNAKGYEFLDSKLIAELKKEAINID